MNLKSYCRGIGAGMIVTALIMGVALSNSKMTDAEVIKRAEELGYSLNTTTLTQLAEQTSWEQKSETEQEKEEKPKESETSLTASVAETSDNPDETDSDTKAEDTKEDDSTDEKLESDDKEEDAESEGEKDSEETETEDAGSDDVKEGEDIPSEEETEDTSEEAESSDDDYISPGMEGESVSIQVIRGDNSVTVAKRLYQAGLIESYDAFDKYLCANGYDKRISVGIYEIYFGMDYDTIAKIITRSK